MITITGARKRASEIYDTVIVPVAQKGCNSISIKLESKPVLEELRKMGLIISTNYKYSIIDLFW